MIVLYMDHMSQPSRAVHILLRQSRGLDWQLALRRISAGEHRTEEIRRLNPERKLPVLVDGEFALAESHAIMRYLCNQYPNALADHWYPREAHQRALVDWALDFHHTATRRGAAGLVFAHLFDKLLAPQMNIEQVAKQKAEAGSILKQALRRINDDFLKEDRFLMGLPDITIADLSAAEEISMLDLLGYDYSGPTTYPRIGAWLERVRAACGDDWTVANAVLNKAAANNKKKREAAAAAPMVKQVQAAVNQTNGSSSSSSSGSWSPAGSSLQTGALMTEIASQLSSPDGQESIKKLQATFKFVIQATSGVGGGPSAVWLLDMKQGRVVELTGDAIDATKADSTFTLNDDNFVALASGKLNPQVAFLSGKLKLGGNLAKAMAFNSAVFQKPKIKEKILEAVARLPKKSKL